MEPILDPGVSGCAGRPEAPFEKTPAPRGSRGAGLLVCQVRSRRKGVCEAMVNEVRPSWVGEDVVVESGSRSVLRVLAGVEMSPGCVLCLRCGSALLFFFDGFSDGFLILDHFKQQAGQKSGGHSKFAIGQKFCKSETTSIVRSR